MMWLLWSVFCMEAYHMVIWTSLSREPAYFGLISIFRYLTSLFSLVCAYFHAKISSLFAGRRFVECWMCKTQIFNCMLNMHNTHVTGIFLLMLPVLLLPITYTRCKFKVTFTLLFYPISPWNYSYSGPDLGSLLLPNTDSATVATHLLLQVLFITFTPSQLTNENTSLKTDRKQANPFLKMFPAIISLPF